MKKHERYEFEINRDNREMFKPIIHNVDDDCGDACQVRCDAETLVVRGGGCGLIEIRNGSEKQIAWATKIKMDKFKEIDGMTFGSTDTLAAAIRILSTNYTDAGWWIGQREKPMTEIIMEVAMSMAYNSISNRIEALREQIIMIPESPAKTEGEVIQFSQIAGAH